MKSFWCPAARAALLAVAVLMLMGNSAMAARPSPSPTPTPSPTSSASPTPNPTTVASPAPTPVGTGTGYYVSPSGNDANSGTSPSNPWQTVAKVNSVAFQPGDVIYFQAGGIWRETLNPLSGGTAGSPLAFAWYGTGDKPIISGADLVSGWKLYRGAIYKASLSTNPGNVFVDGGPGWGLVNASSLGAMTPGSFCWRGGTLYVELADQSNPANHTMEAAVRVYGYETNTGSCTAMSYITVDGLYFQRTAGWGIYFHCYAGPPYLAGIVIENNTVSQTGTGQVDQGQYYNGIHVLNEPYVSYNNGAAPQILNNVVSFAGGHGNDINIQGSDSAYIAGNDVSNWNHNGIDLKDSIGVVEEFNVAHDQPNTGSGFYCEDQYKPGSAQVDFEQGIAYNVSNGVQVSLDCEGTLYNNSIYNAGSGIYFGPQAVSLIAENNALNQTTVALNGDGLGTITLEDYNDLGANAVIEFGGTIYSLSNWIAPGGPHAHDIAADPQWVNPAGADFSLLSGSPCIDAGTDVGLLYNGVVADDMGAIEYPY